MAETETLEKASSAQGATPDKPTTDANTSGAESTGQASPPAQPTPPLTSVGSFKMWDTQKGVVEVGEEEKPPQQEQQVQVTTVPPPLPEEFAKKGMKSWDDVSKSYKELEKTFHAKTQELADLKKKQEPTAQQAETKAVEGAVTKAVAEAAVEEQEDLAGLLINNPKEFERRMVEKAAKSITSQWEIASKTQKTISDWEQQNPDLKEQSHLVSAEIRRILEANPQRKGDDMSVLLNEATGNIRSFLGQVRNQAIEEDRTVRQSVQSLGVSSIPQQPGQNPPAQGVSNQASEAIDPTDAAIAERQRRYRQMTGEIPLDRLRRQ